jgi:hypothetical protein
VTATAQRCLAHYEELRGRVLAGRALGSRLGLSLLLCSGMAAWLEGWASCPQVEPAVQTTQTPARVEPIADECCAGVVSVLASMALGNLTEAIA